MRSALVFLKFTLAEDSWYNVLITKNILTYTLFLTIIIITIRRSITAQI